MVRSLSAPGQSIPIPKLFDWLCLPLRTGLYGSWPDNSPPGWQGSGNSHQFETMYFKSELKIKIVMVAAVGIESGGAMRAARAGLQVFVDGEFATADAAQDGKCIAFGAGPNGDGMAGKFDVAVLAGVVGAAAFHANGDDVERRMVVRATGLRVDRAVDGDGNG